MKDECCWIMDHRFHTISCLFIQDANSKVGFTMGHIEMQNSSSKFDMTYDEDDMYG